LAPLITEGPCTEGAATTAIFRKCAAKTIAVVMLLRQTGLEIPDHFLMDHLSPMVVMKRELGLLKPSEAEAKLLGLYNKWWAENKATYLVGGDSALFNPSDDLPDTVLRFIQGPSFADHDDPMDEDYDWSAYQAEEDYEEDGGDYEDGNQSYDEEYDYEPEEEQAAAAPPPCFSVLCHQEAQDGCLL